MKFAIVLLMLFFASLCWADNLEIRDPAVVANLVEMQRRIDTVSAAVMACLDTGKAHQGCMCANRERFVQFTQTVNQLFAEHPQLQGQDLVSFKGADGLLINQSLEGIKRQAEMQLDCPE